MSAADKLMRPSAFPMIEPEEATRRIFDNVAAPQLAQAETISLVEGAGRVLAQDIVASQDSPPFATTAVDGYALIAGDGDMPRQILGDQMAGQMGELSVRAGSAIRIMTGAPLPAGADSVIMVEFTSEQTSNLQLQFAPQPGDNVRPQGQDLKAGQAVLTAGTIIGSAEIGLIATVNLPHFKVYRQPKIAIISTGDEIVEPGETARPGQIYDSNRFSLIAAVAAAHCQPVSLGIAPDTYESLRELVLIALEQYDGLITSGGVSVGKHDLVKDLLEELGTIHFGRVNLKPGKPLTFVTVEKNGFNKPVFGLPGFPVSSLVSFELFVRPALLKMSGRTNLYRPKVQARLEHTVSHSPDRNEYVRAVLTSEYLPESQSYQFTARTTGAQNSSRLLSMLGANALLHLPPGDNELPAGTLVTAIVVDSSNALADKE